MLTKRNWLVCLLILAFSTVLITGCGDTDPSPAPDAYPQAASNLSGKLVIYHAGSLTVPFEALEKEFESLHPDVDIQREAGGSRTIARKVVDMGNKVDILASADYTVIDTMLIPDQAKWNACFGKNSMVIMYTDKSKYADEINKDNWYEILLKDDVNYGHSDPNADPCGYRSVLSWQLAEKKYEQAGLFEELSNGCPDKNIRPKSVELITMLETGALDYAFEYESVARQHALKDAKFKWIELPGKINLSESKHSDYYKDATIELNGKEPGTTVTKVGEPIIYGITMPLTGENNELAIEFLKFFFDREQGLKILEDNGQPVLDKIVITGDNFPDDLQQILK